MTDIEATESVDAASSTVNRYRAQYDRLATEPLSVVIVEAVATVLDEDVTQLEPIHYSINADALERLFAPRSNGLRSSGSVTFDYHGCRVTVDAGGEVEVVRL